MSNALVLVSEALRRQPGKVTVAHKVLLAFAQGKRKWRTMEGLAGACKIEPQECQKALGRLYHTGYLRLSLSQGLQGKPIYALAKSDHDLTEFEE